MISTAEMAEMAATPTVAVRSCAFPAPTSVHAKDDQPAHLFSTTLETLLTQSRYAAPPGSLADLEFVPPRCCIDSCAIGSEARAKFGVSPSCSPVVALV